MADRCRSCGGSEFINAIDNHGEAYRGCARCRVGDPSPPQRRWRKVGPHEYTRRMGPLVVEVTRWGPYVEMLDEWGWRAMIGAVQILQGHHVRKGAPLAQCQADAIAAVERWRDAIR